MITVDSPFKRFRRVLALGLAVAFVLQNTINTSEVVTKSRFYRDLTNQTPFYDVEVTNVNVAASTITLSGEMKKRRCEFDKTENGLVGYVKFHDDLPKVRVAVDTSVEDAVLGKENTTRPSSFDAESWGPWVLEYSGSVKPISWEIYAGHWCPVYDNQRNIVIDDYGSIVTKFESNLFVKGLWN